MFGVDMALLQALVVLVALVFVDVLLGIAIALRKGEFSLGELPRFLKTEVLPYLMSLGSLVFLAMLDDVQQYGFKVLAWGAVAAYGTRMVFIELRKKVVTLFGPLEPVPVQEVVPEHFQPETWQAGGRPRE